MNEQPSEPKHPDGQKSSSPPKDLIAYILGAYALLGLSAIVALNLQTIETPGELVATVGAAVGALAQRLNAGNKEG